ncbi:unnamed protein product [Urochloa humidicola]
MKGGRLPQQAAPLRLESRRFRLLSIVVGCFVFCVVFLLSSRPDTTAFDTVSVRPRASLSGTYRRPAAVKTMRTASSAGFGGGDFHVDIRPLEQGKKSAEQSTGDTTATEWVRDTVIVEERSDAEASEAELAQAERDSDGNAAASNSDDQPAPGGENKGVHDDAAVTTATAAETTATAPHRPEEKVQAAGGGQSKLQQEKQQPARQQQEERHEPARSIGGDHRQPARPPLCDFSDFRSDICDLAGDVRLDANASAFVVVNPAGDNQSHKVRPYPRKGDETCMSRITELTVRSSSPGATLPRCTATHAAPAVAFSIGGYTGNIFHDFSDVLVPLYNTAHRYGGDVHLVMANVASWWLIKYDKLLRSLSRHPPLDLAKSAASNEVHCFPNATVSLRAHKELIIEPSRSADGLATPDFTRFIRRALSLPHDAPTRLGDGTGRKPRLLIISRHRTRLLLNLADVVRAAEEVGFEAVVNESDVGNDISEVGALVNSCDAMVGVHGAMGLRYVQYEVGVGESTLKDKFPAGHQIFTNPTGLHKKGFAFIRHTLMDGQDITVDVGRFKEVLQQVLNSLAQ